MGLVFVGDWLPEEPLVVSSIWPEHNIVGNLECAFADSGPARFKAYTVTLGMKSIGTVGAAGFAALSVANNHTNDAGGVAFDEFNARLTGMGVRTYGTRQKPFVELDIDGLRCAVIGSLERCRARGDLLFPQERVSDLIREIRGTFDKVFITPHWGHEGEYAFHPSPAQRRTARRWIDAGADGVIGHHPHTIHGRELVDVRPIYYSLGNFCFPHEEGDAYPLTGVGLAATWDPKSGAPGTEWTHEFVAQIAGVPTVERGLISQAMSNHFEAISADLGSTQLEWGWNKWARTVGPIAMMRTRRSWERRFHKHPGATLLLWIVWNLLPKTMMLRIGSFWPNSAILNRIAKTVETIIEGDSASRTFGILPTEYTSRDGANV